MILPHLILQKPVANLKVNEIREIMVTRMELWDKNDISTLLREGLAIQKRLKSRHSKKQQESMVKSFQQLMSNGDLNAVIRRLDIVR